MAVDVKKIKKKRTIKITCVAACSVWVMFWGGGRVNKN